MLDVVKYAKQIPIFLRNFFLLHEAFTGRILHCNRYLLIVRILLTRHLSNTAAVKSLQLCPTLCDPIDGSPPGSLVPGILQARTLEWVAISFSSA